MTSVAPEYVQAAWALAVEACERLHPDDPAAEALTRAVLLLSLGRVSGARRDLRAAAVALVGDVDRELLVGDAIAALGGDV